MGANLIFGLSGLTFIRGKCLFKTGRLLNFHHFQPHIFSKFFPSTKQRRKSSCSIFIPSIYVFFLGGGEVAGEGALIRGWTNLLEFHHFLPHLLVSLFS